MRRRTLLKAAILPAMGALGGPLWSALIAEAQAQPAPAAGAQATLFDAFTVRQMARERAQKPYKAPDTKLPAQLDKLSYDDYRNIRFNAERALWRGDNLKFQLQLLHRGFLFRDKVDLFVVSEGQARPVAYQPDLFRFEHGLAAPNPADSNLGFSGFRIHSPLNRADYFDEVAVFQGASYFRAIAKGQVYGSSARGLSVKTGDPAGEEFPVFVAYWIEKPQASGDSIVLHALLDSASAAAAFRFTIRPGNSTNMAVEMTLYPRADIDKAGIGTLTSMFFFGPNDRDGTDDFRPMVADAGALSVANGRGERLWRPLQNPRNLEFSVFADTNTRGFGLMQRQRSFFDYQDLEARYEKRPSVWVEPIGDWGEGAVHLIEIPTKEEIHDNIVAFWRPKDPLRKGGEYSYTYRLHWAWDQPDPPRLARFGDTRTGLWEGGRIFVTDLVGPGLTGEAGEKLRAEVSTSAGGVRNVVLQPNPEIDGARLSFILDAPGDAPAELRAQLMRGDELASEVWIYRWKA